MADLLDGVARYLEVLGLLSYDPTGRSGDTFMETMPSGPDECVALSIYGGPEADSLLPYDEPALQVRTRARDPRVSRDRGVAIRDELHGLGPITLPDGTLLLSCIAIQSAPATIGQDAVGRHEHTVNYRTEVHAPSAHRDQ